MMDLHTHLDLYPDAIRLAHKVNETNAFTLCVTTSPRAWRATSGFFSQFVNIEVALGLHPEIVSRKYEEKNLMLQNIPFARYIGEIGLDGSPQSNTSSRTLQRQVFGEVLFEVSRAGGRVMSIHSRRAVSEVLLMLKAHPNVGIPILHWFSGSLSELREAINMGCYFSVNTLMATSERGAYLISLMPHDKVLPESDGPFAIQGNLPLSPMSSNEVAYLLSTIWKIDKEEVQLGFESTLRHIQCDLK